MGCFSWMFADTNNILPLNIGMPCYLMCPNDIAIYEPSYDGYGHFDCYDVYDLVVDWNRRDISSYLQHSSHKSLYPWPSSFISLLEKSMSVEDIDPTPFFSNNKWLKSEWKRTLGIDISCYDDQNIMLKYPIKIAMTPNVPYELLPASIADVNQGFG